MAQPTWVTGSGSLGTIPEGKFYRASLEAYDPDFPTDSTKVKYIKVSGALPTGIQITSNGTVEGTPTASIQGVPQSVSQNVTSKFAIRVFTETVVNGAIVQDRLADRTFTITVTGQDAPEFVTPSGELGKFFDGELVNKQIEFTDTDPGDTAIVTLVSGSLPPGVTIDSTGLIYGYIAPATNISGVTPGWENEPFDANPLQFNTGTISKNYEFTLQITDGTDYNIRTFWLYVGIATADSTAYTADSTVLTVDTVTQAPFISPYTTELGTFLHDNFFAYQVKAFDYNNDTLNYSLTGTLPSGIVLDIDTGVLHGTLPDIGLTEEEFNFSITVYRKENSLVSNTFAYSMKVIGDIDTGVIWQSPSNLGSMDNDDISTLAVKATAVSGTVLKYRLKQGGVYNKLPQGLTLQSSGDVVGRVIYEMFGVVDRNITADNNTTVDSNLTTADTNGSNIVTFDNNTTTFDNVFRFTVEAYSDNGQISTFKDFSITIIRKYDRPLCELHIRALLPKSSRTILNSLLGNAGIFNPALLYRPNDPYFGSAKEVTYIHSYELSPATINEYIESIKLSHYNKQITLGAVKTAQALDDNGNILYEVVYSELVDDLTNNKNASVSRNVNTEAGVVYPNSFSNMRDQVVSKVGKPSSDLPRWMLSKQTDGTILGFVPSWIIAYALPGQSGLISYNISKLFGSQLNKINFIADRYTLKGQFAKNYDTEDQQWIPTDETTFDIYEHAYSVDSTTITSDNSTLNASSFDNTSTETVFDDGSCVFIGIHINSADISTKTADNISITADNGLNGTVTTYHITDKYDRYLFFPKSDIINTRVIT